ncbi:hypothetical protein [Pseudomonas sp. PDM20]|uniref:hypothetical protein n=1 Tax=Pseudomonas sp. PDM20 TaxID=2769254 RepID=UPI001781958B|nr:hypothetical protein [Pseudomonas sp. PDM20]MBD9680895.1 hypothetical protein [Pseudomonas sp. PDM20]
MNTSTLLPDASEPRKIQLNDSLPLNADRDGVTEAELYNLIKVVLLDSSLSAEEKRVLIDEVRKSTPASDRWTYRYAIYGLLLIVLVAVVGSLVLSAKAVEVPESVVAIGATAVGGLAGLLSPTRKR